MIVTGLALRDWRILYPSLAGLLAFVLGWLRHTQQQGALGADARYRYLPHLPPAKLAPPTPGHAGHMGHGATQAGSQGEDEEEEGPRRAPRG